MDVIKQWKRELATDVLYRSLGRDVIQLILIWVAKSSVRGLKTIRLLSKHHKNLVDSRIHYSYYNMKIRKLFSTRTCGPHFRLEFTHCTKHAIVMRHLLFIKNALFEQYNTFGGNFGKKVLSACANYSDGLVRFIMRTLVSNDQFNQLPRDDVLVFLTQYFTDESRATRYVLSVKNMNRIPDWKTLLVYIPQLCKLLFPDGNICLNNIPISGMEKFMASNILRFILGSGLWTRHTDKMKKFTYGTLQEFKITHSEWKQIIKIGSSDAIRTILEVYYSKDRKHHDLLLRWANDFDNPPVKKKRRKK